MNNRYLFEFVFGTLLEENKYYPDIKRLLKRLEQNGYEPAAKENQPWILCGLLNNWLQGGFEKKQKQYADPEVREILARLTADYCEYEKSREEKEHADDPSGTEDCGPLFFDI